MVAAIEVARNIIGDPNADFLRLHRIKARPKRFDEQPGTAAVELSTFVYNCIHFLRRGICKIHGSNVLDLMEKHTDLRMHLIHC